MDQRRDLSRGGQLPPRRALVLELPRVLDAIILRRDDRDAISPSRYARREHTRFPS